MHISDIYWFIGIYITTALIKQHTKNKLVERAKVGHRSQ